MVYRKIKYKIIGYSCLCVLFLFSCKKEAKEPIQITMHAILAHNNQAVQGIKWHISESKGGGIGSNQEVTDWELNGETDANGISVIEFYPLKNKKYYYDISFDYSSMDVPGGEYSVVHGPTSFARLIRENSNDYEIRILPKMDVQVHYKNVNCYDANDDFRYKVANVDESIYHNFNSQPWSDPQVLEGCVDYPNGGGQRLAGHYVYVWEATRNGIIETGIDTFYVSPDGNNLIEMFW